MSIDLAEINPDWAGQKVYMLCPFEPYEGYIGDNTTKYHNEYTAPNWLAFRLTDDNKFEFLGKEGYFERTAIHNWDFDSEEEEEIQEMQKEYEENKANFKKYGALVLNGYADYDGNLNVVNYLDTLGGELQYGNWCSTIENEEYPKAFKMHIEDGEEDDEVVFDISYKGNPFYLISEATAFHWVGAGGYIICFMSLLAVLCYSLLIIRKKNKLINIKNNDSKRRNPRTERPFAGVPQSRRYFCKRATVAQKSFFAPDAY